MGRMANLETGVEAAVVERDFADSDLVVLLVMCLLRVVYLVMACDGV